MDRNFGILSPQKVASQIATTIGPAEDCAPIPDIISQPGLEAATLVTTGEAIGIGLPLPSTPMTTEGCLVLAIR